MHAVIKIQIRSLNLLLLQSALGNLLVGSILDKFGIGFLASDLLNSLAEIALDLVALPGRDIGIEENVNLFKSLSMRLGICKKYVDSHGKAEDTEDDVGFPLDVGESGSNEVLGGKN